MSRNDKLYGRLEQLEEEFRAMIVGGLEDAKAAGDGWVFCDPEFDKAISTWCLKERPKLQRLINLAAEITALRDKLNEPYENSIVAVYKLHAARYNVWDDHHRLGLRRSAAELLSQIEAVRQLDRHEEA